MLDPGFYANLFEVIIPEREIEIMITRRSNYPSLKELRDEIETIGKKIFVYAPERSDKIYGYGKDMEWLSSKGFSHGTVNLHNEPRLTGNMIFQGVIKKAEELNYVPFFGKEKGRCRLFDWMEFKAPSNKQIKIFRGYDIRVIFLNDPMENKLTFGLIVDVAYSLKDLNEQPLDYRTIISRYGSNILREVRQIQRDLLPTGINREVSRQRLIEDIIPFVEKLQKIELPCGLEVKITLDPSRVILGE